LTSRFPQILLGGFYQNILVPGSAYVTEAYFTPISGTWWGVMSVENNNGIGYTLNYYY
jgi:hypothetical protein